MCDGKEPDKRRRLAWRLYDLGMRTENLKLKRTRLIRVGNLAQADRFGRRNRIREEGMVSPAFRVSVVQAGTQDERYRVTVTFN